MKAVYETLQKLRAESGSKAKLAILTSEKDNDDLRAYLRMAYEPKINFFIQKVQPNLVTMSQLGLASQMGQDQFTYDLLCEIYDTIAKRELTGNAARNYLACLYHQLNDEGKELLTLLIQRDVKCGISVNTINKVWPGLITDVPYMRCRLPRDANLVIWPWARGVYSEIKADGMFANVNHHNKTGAVTIESRAGSPMPLDYFRGLVDEVKNLVPQGFQMHGELLMLKDGKILPREEGNGMFNSLLKGGELEPGCTPIYQAWDMIPIAEAKVKGKYHKPYESRFELLRSFIGSDINSPLHAIEYKMVYSLTEAYAHCREAMLRGLEGTVIKHPDMIWEDSSSGSEGQVKLKLEFTVELRVVGFNAADSKSKNASTFGSLQCESSCGQLKVGVTGIKDDKRKEIFNNAEDWTGGDKIISVTANGIMAPSVSTNGFYSLFLPRFSEERLDKKEADSLERIKEIQQAAIETGNMISK